MSSNASSSSALSTSNIGAEAMGVFHSLDKGLRSSIVSEQCESIVRISSELVSQYPLPIIVNTALLRIADLFKNCENNFVRYWIVQVFEEVRAELPKVINKQELIKRIANVLESNDPMARALTLRYVYIYIYIIIIKIMMIIFLTLFFNTLH